MTGVVLPMRDSFEVGIDHPRAADAPHQIIASERCVTGRQPFEVRCREKFVASPSECLVESVPLLAQRVVDQQKAAVGKKAPQNLDLFLGEGFKFVFAGHVKKRIIEQVAVRDRDFLSYGGCFDAGAQHQLFHERSDGQGMRIPVAAAILDLGEDELDRPFFLGRGRLAAARPRRQRFEIRYG